MSADRLAPGAVALDPADVLGQGADFIVYGGRLDGRAVVVKAAVDPRAGEVERLEAQLLREREALERLDHPAIPEAFGLWRLPDGRLGLVRARRPGATLSEVIQRALVRQRYQGARRWTPATRAILAGIAGALTHVHARGLVHNDVKPDNVLVHKTGGGELAVTLLDFDVAGRDCAGGTVRYAAPERLQGGPGSVRGDVFAFGVLVYQTLTGTHPFPSATLADALLEREVPVEAPRGEAAQRAWESLPPQVQGALARALSADRRKRPRSVARFAKELGLDGAHLAAHAGGRARGGKRRQPALAHGAGGWGTLVAALVATAVVGAAAGLAGPPAAVGPKGSARAPTPAERACLTAMGQRAERICARAEGDDDARARCAEALTALNSPAQCEARMRQLATCPADRMGGAP